MAEPKAPNEADLEKSRMPFMEHLRELRDRIRNAAIALIVGMMVAFAFKQELFVLLARPLMVAWQDHQLANPAVGAQNFYFGSLIEPFWTYFSISLWAGIFVASPFIFYQLWKFIAPGLYKHERRMGVLFAICSALCFVGGAAFCYFLVLPAVYDFLLGYATANLSEMSGALGMKYELGSEVALRPHLFMQEYLDFARKLLIGFGIVFELPLAIFFLSLIGLVTHRGLWKFNRYWVVISVVIGAVLTPPDVISQLFMAGPLVVLYNISIVISYFVTRRREKREAAFGSHDKSQKAASTTDDE